MARKKNREADPIEEEARRDGADLDTESEEPTEVEVEEEPEGDPDAELDREERPSRGERRAERGRDYRTVRERAAAAEARAQALQEELERSRAAAPPPAQRQEQGPAPETATLQADLDRVYADQERLNQEFDARQAQYVNAKRQMPSTEVEDFKKRAKELRLGEMRLIRRIDDANEAPARRQEEQQRAFYNRAPDVFGDERARTWAFGEYNRRVAENPSIDREQLFNDAVEGARRVIFGKRPPPDQAARQRASGVSRGAGAPANGGPLRVQMTPAMKKIAAARFPKLEPADAYKKWAQVHGKEFIEAEREAGR